MVTQDILSTTPAFFKTSLSHGDRSLTTKLRRTLNRPLVTKMSQQYPGQHPNSSRASMLPTGYAPTYIHGSIPQVGPHGHNPITGHHMHPDPSQLPPMALQRSMSTPDTRRLFQAGHDAFQTISGGERRRNKLGYHRTSVACGKSVRIRRSVKSGNLLIRPLPAKENSMHSLSKR